MFDEIEHEKNIGNKNIASLIFIICALLFFFVAIMVSKSAHAQVSSEPWGFKAQNRASIAALMQQVENKNQANNGAAVISGSGYDQLVCGGDGESAATGNSTCIIMNNSSGAVEIGQDAAGSQEATTTENTTINDMSDALEGISE